MAAGICIHVYRSKVGVELKQGWGGTEQGWGGTEQGWGGTETIIYSI